MNEVYNDESHLLVDEAFEQASKIKGWNKFESILYMSQRARMLGVNGQYHKDKRMNQPLVDTKSVNKNSVVIEEMAAGKFFEV